MRTYLSYADQTNLTLPSETVSNHSVKIFIWSVARASGFGSPGRSAQSIGTSATLKVPVGSKLPPIAGNAEKIALYLLRSTLFSISLQSSVLALVVVGAMYFSEAIVVVVVFFVVAIFFVALCQTSLLPDLTQTKLTFFVFASAPTRVHLPPTLAAFAGLIIVASNVTKTKAAKPNLAFCRAMSQVLHTRSAMFVALHLLSSRDHDWCPNRFGEISA